MATPLNSVWNGTGLPTVNYNPNISTNPFKELVNQIAVRNQTLPNGGGSYNPAGGAKITKPPVFTGIPAVAPQPAPQPETVADWQDKYRDPKTGKVMTPKEYAIYLGNKIPKGSGDVGQYAGDAMSNPNQTAGELNTTANNLNNARNDIATGTTDPYKVGAQSGIAYSPEELSAIEKAYAGVYDPALNDVFNRLKEKQTADAAEAKAKADREAQIFQTNENIRQWQATTGTRGGNTGSTKDLFTQTQLNTAARNAGIGVTAVQDMDPDLVNFFLAPPKVKTSDGTVMSIDKMFANDMKSVTDGTMTADEVSQEILNADNLSEAVKTYFVDQIPNEPAKKESWLSSIWNAVLGK